jgi:hypothetical protein
LYIEFSLPTGASGMAAAHAHRRLALMLDAWSQRYGVKHQSKSHKYTVRVTFDDDQSYALFALTWNPGADPQWKNYFANYRLIEPMKNLY